MKKNLPSSFRYLVRFTCILMIVLIQLPAVSLAFEDRKFNSYNTINSSPKTVSDNTEQTDNSNLVVFSNTASIAIADKANNNSGTPNGISSPYPSTIAVSGLAGTVSDVNVTITGINTGRARDLNFALVAPNGAALMLLGDGGDLNAMTNVNLTFDDSAASLVPNPGAITSGNFRPTDHLFSATDSDEFPAPGPTTVNNPAPEGAATLASIFNGITPNGNWSLYIVDDSFGGGTSSVSGGWSIDITTNAVIQGTNTTVVSNLNPALTTQSITFTSTTTLSTGGTPVNAGTVSFTNNGAAIAGCTNVAVNGSGQATCTTTLAEGTRNITATFNGTSTLGISSGSVTQIVNSPTVQTGGLFCNNGGFTIADPGTGSVYPSNINVTGLIGTIATAKVRLNSLSSPRPSNLDFLLVGSNGQAFQFMSDVGDATTAVSNINLIADDAAGSQFPTGTALTGGTFRPTDFNAVGESDIYPAPAPGSFNRAAPVGSSTFTSLYFNSNPNGNWTLYSVDDGVGGGVSTVGSWCVDFTLDKIGTTTTVTSSNNPSIIGQNVTFTATVTATSGVPTGTVEFFDGATSLGTGTLTPTTGSSAQATLTTNALPAGSRTITAVYAGTTGAGGGGFLGSSSPPITQTVNAPSLSINDVSAAEGNSGTTNFTFTVNLSQASTQTVTVNYATANGTATAPGDYTAGSGTLSFAAGETTKTIIVPVVGDTTVESDETFFVNLSSPSNATIADNQGLGTIQNDDVPTLSIGDVSTLEGNSGTTNFVFSVSLSQASPQTVTVDFATADGTATVAGGDYSATNGTLTFAPGDTAKTITVSVNGDTMVELNETFFVNLTNPTNASIADGQGLGTIQNDDTPTLSINDVSAVEGNSGTTAFVFTVTLSQASPQSVTVDYATANGTATAGSDYTAGNGSLTFAPGDLTKTVSITVSGDTTVEPDETFFVNLTNAANATILDAQGLGTIQNDDVPTLSINDVSAVEGNSGTSNFTFTVTLSQASPLSVSVDYATANGTATAGSDYTAGNGSLTFAPGDLTKTITVSVNGDTTTELDETFFVNLSNPSNSTIADNQGLGTIQNDDIPTLSINDVSQTEGNSGTSVFAFTVTLSQASPSTVSVDYATADGTATVAGNDYTAGNGTLTFAPGDLTKTVSITVNGDTSVELNEDFFVNLTNPSNATISDNQGTGTILNDDSPTLSINDVSAVEGNSGTSNFAFTITLSQASPLSVSVDYATADGTATVANNDYAAIPTTSVTFAPGETTKTVNVTVNGDTTVELNETFFVNLSNATNATIVDNQGLGTIQNDDVPTLSIANLSQIEGNSGTSNFVFNVTLSQSSPLTVTANFATANGTATAGSDYTAANGTLTFAPGDLTKTVTVSVTGDVMFEFNETFFVNLTNATNATFADDQAIGTIINDDSQSLRINNVRVREGNSGTATAAFTVTLMPDQTRPEGNSTAATVQYQTLNGTAQAGSDYVAASGTLTFQPGETEKTISVTINGDLNKEANETFFVELFNPVNASIADEQAYGIIIDEDRAYVSDFDNDKRTDFSVYRPSTNVWYVLQSTNLSPNILTFGQSGDIPVPGDYDGDGITDRAVYRPSEGNWYILQSSNSALLTKTLGQPGDKPVQGDYDGDSKTDAAVYRPSAGSWLVLRSSNNQTVATQFGIASDVPVQGDYDGDARTDLAVYRDGIWFVLRSSDSSVAITQWGIAGDRPVSGDFDGDGQNDLTVYRNGTWWILNSLTGGFSAVQWGVSDDKPAAGDFDGDGITDITVFRPSTGDWYVLKSSDSVLAGINWGLAEDIPAPSAIIPQ